MSVRNSLLVWVSGAVLGWVVAVVAIYSLLRASDQPLVAEDPGAHNQPPPIAQEANPKDLNQITPAAGEDQPK